jgi:hypothetical protein
MARFAQEMMRSAKLSAFTAPICPSQHQAMKGEILIWRARRYSRDVLVNFLDVVVNDLLEELAHFERMKS